MDWIRDELHQRDSLSMLDVLKIEPVRSDCDNYRL